MTSNDAAGPKTFFDTWMKSMTDYWANMAQSPFSNIFDANTGNQSEKQNSAQKKNSDNAKKAAHDAATAATLEALKAVSAAMTHPDSLMASLKSIGAMPDVLAKMIEPAIGNAAAFSQQLLGKMEKSGDYVPLSGIQEMDREALSIWSKFYDAEFRKFLHIPQLGLNRFHQEKINRYLDKIAELETAMGEFLSIVFKPFKDAYTSFEEEVAEMAKKDELPEDHKAYYRQWIKHLEGHYMNLFRSPEYLMTLSKTLNASAAHTIARRELIDVFLHAFSVPSTTDIEEMHKELYQLKRRLNRLEKTAFA